MKRRLPVVSSAPRRLVLHLACQVGPEETDGLVATLCGVALQLPRSAPVGVHIFDRGLPERTRRCLDQLLSARFPQLSLNFLSRAPGPSNSALRSLPDLLPNVSRVVWLSCDLLVDADLSPLADRPLHGALAAAVVEADMKADQPEFNSGVMILDLARMRMSGLTRAAKFLDGNRVDGEDDHAVLNAWWRGKWIPLESRWNRQIIQRPEFSIYRSAAATVWRFTGLKPGQFHRSHARGLVADYYQLFDRIGWLPCTTPQLRMTGSRARDALKRAYAASQRHRWIRHNSIPATVGQHEVQPCIKSLPLCVLIPLGPGHLELTRLGDLLASCLAYADRPLQFVIVNDGNDSDAIGEVGAGQGAAFKVIPNPRQREGNWWTGGMAVGELAALIWVAENRPCCGVLKVDTDALVINVYASRIAEIFAIDPTIGLIGNFESPTGAPIPPGHSMTSTLYWRSKRIAHDRELKRLLFAFVGWRRRIRLLIGRASQHGYTMGDWCQGGAYALSPEFLRRLVADDSFARPRDFLELDFCEDVLMALITYALQLRIHYTAGPARLFASKWRGLAGSPAALGAAGHGIIHSLKNDPFLSEAEIRSYFAHRRPPPARVGATNVQRSPCQAMTS